VAMTNSDKMALFIFSPFLELRSNAFYASRPLTVFRSL
jgi:hypothetical protein